MKKSPDTLKRVITTLSLIIISIIVFTSLNKISLKEYKPRDIILFGDSITQHGYKQSGWVSGLSAYYIRRFDVVNRGFSGFNTRVASKLIDPILKSGNAKLVTIFFGSNDACVNPEQHVDVSDYIENLKTIIKKITEHSKKTKILLITPPPMHEESREKFLLLTTNTTELFEFRNCRKTAVTKLYRDACINVGKQTETPVLDTWEIFSDADRLGDFFEDGLHFNVEGNLAFLNGLQNKLNETFSELRLENSPFYIPDFSVLDEKKKRQKEKSAPRIHRHTEKHVVYIKPLKDLNLTINKMLFLKTLLLATSALPARSARPTATPMCDYYTTALFKTNTEANQLALLTALVNRAVIGNFSATTTNIAVPGILADGIYEKTPVSLIGFFTGKEATTNIGGVATAVNFLDDGGAEPLKAGKGANGTSSKQYFLLLHLYQIFGSLLGCTKQGGEIFPNYGGNPSMYETHKFMNIDPAMMGYFITQVALAAQSFGVEKEDITIVVGALTSLFNKMCSPPTVLAKGLTAASQYICQASNCPKDPKSTCPAARTATASSLMPTETTGATKGSGGIRFAVGALSVVFAVILL